MAVMHASMKTVSRSAGRSAVAAVAYRSGTEITDERTGLTHDYTRKGGVVHTEVLLPDGATADRAVLWNAVEAKHKRGDALVAREIELALPAELTDAQRQELAVSYGREVADRYGVAVDVAIHRPSREGDERNHHAHLMVSACHVDRDMKMGSKAVELDPIHCQRNGLENAADHERERWASLCNEALERAGHQARIDHRSLQAQRLDAERVVQDEKRSNAERAAADAKALELSREPQVKLGPVATAMERRGEKSDRGDMLRAVQARNFSLEALKAEFLNARKRVIEMTHALAEKTREMGAAVKEATKAAVGKVFAKPAPAKPVPALTPEQRETQRLERMTAKELRAEIEKATPQPVELLVRARPEIIAAEKTRVAFGLEFDKASNRLSLAQREIRDWRQENKGWAKAHDTGFWKSAEYMAMVGRAEEAQRLARIAERRFEVQKGLEVSLWENATAEVKKAQEPDWDHVKRLRVALVPKNALEKQERIAQSLFETLAAEVERGGPDVAKYLEAAPPELRAKLAEHNALEKGNRHNPNSPRRQYRDQLTGPAFMKAMDRYQANAKDMGLELGKSLGVQR
ncbi:MAG: MobQ family relaxase [Rhizomicrobium sp.]|nr:MobQ family relaxase [Rhizomicrobium sp.]